MANPNPAAQKIAIWRDNPAQFAFDVFGFTPDAWQEDVLRLAGKPGLKRIAMKACAGPGKTAVLAIMGWHRLLCYAAPGEHPKGLAISCTADNLKANLWSELAKWQGRSELLKSAFKWTKERIFAIDHPATWFLDFRAYPQSADPETCARALSGHHSDYPFYLIDESGDMPTQVLRAAEQGLTTAKDGLIVTAGNTTSHSGLLYYVSSTLRDQWDVISITADPDDPKRTPRVDIEWAREQIATYGRENAWVQAYILGQFPAASINALLSVDEVETAMRREIGVNDYVYAQKRLGVDVARFGDDRTVIFPRQGLAAHNPVVMRHQDTMLIAARVAQGIQKWEPEIVAVDDTGHWGHGVIDSLNQGGYPTVGIQFHGRPIDPRYANRRAEMWFLMAEWIKRGGVLPHMPELVKELTSITYFFSEGKLQLESKDQLKKRVGSSPDLADALALTFAWPEMPNSSMPLHSALKTNQKIKWDYDPFAKED